MKLQTKRYVHLSDIEKQDIISNARNVDQEISSDEFIEYIELVISRAVDLVETDIYTPPIKE